MKTLEKPVTPSGKELENIKERPSKRKKNVPQEEEEAAGKSHDKDLELAIQPVSNEWLVRLKKPSKFPILQSKPIEQLIFDSINIIEYKYTVVLLFPRLYFGESELISFTTWNHINQEDIILEYNCNPLFYDLSLLDFLPSTKYYSKIITPPPKPNSRIFIKLPQPTEEQFFKYDIKVYHHETPIWKIWELTKIIPGKN